MWRTRAVVSMLVEDIAGLQIPANDPAEGSLPVEPSEREALDKAKKRARLVVAVDCLALLVLFVFRDSTRPFLPAGRSIETVFTLGVLAVAAHVGFRSAQLQSLRAVERLCRELRERQ